MPRGGKRTGAGRPKGSRSAANKEQIANLSDLAKTHAETALDALVKVASKGVSEAARVSAANAILDRAYGKPAQDLTLSGPDGGPIEHKVTNARERISERLAGLNVGGAADGDQTEDTVRPN